ncbi:hypothetical protein V6N13_065528 [Hibiscus sabdariffa]
MVASRQQKFTIRSLNADDGTVLHTQAEIADEAVRFFQNLLGSSDAAVSGCNLQLLKGIIGYSFSDFAVVELSKKVTRDEVKAAVFEHCGRGCG